MLPTGTLTVVEGDIKGAEDLNFEKEEAKRVAAAAAAAAEEDRENAPKVLSKKIYDIKKMHETDNITGLKATTDESDILNLFGRYRDYIEESGDFFSDEHKEYIGYIQTLMEKFHEHLSKKGYDYEKMNTLIELRKLYQKELGERISKKYDDYEYLKSKFDEDTKKIDNELRILSDTADIDVEDVVTKGPIRTY